MNGVCTMVDRLLRAAGGDKWLAGQLAYALRLVREGRPGVLVNVGDGRSWAAGYIVRAFGLDT